VLGSTSARRRQDVWLVERRDIEFEANSGNKKEIITYTDGEGRAHMRSTPMTIATQTLPPYPSAHARSSLTPSQLVQLNRTISSALHQTLARSPAQLDVTRFVSTYARDHAFRTLQSLIWQNTEHSSADEKVIRKNLSLLSDKVASCPSGIDIQTLLNLSIIYGPTNHSRTRALFSLSFTTTPSLLQNVRSGILPAFVGLLSRDTPSGLYELRKTAQCMSCFLHASPIEAVRIFTSSNGFMTVLARVYDERLASIAASYGGLHHLQAQEPGRTLDVWERVWLETKVALMDSFHIIMGQLLNDVSISSEADLALQSDHLLDLIFGLLDVPSSPSGSQSVTNSIVPMPFLNRSLLADYQHAYKVSQFLASAFAHSAEKDPRLDVLEASFQTFDAEVGHSSASAGALRLLVPSLALAGNAPVRATSKSQESQRGESSLMSDPFVWC
jgi:activating signal cointegrator complex subunit 2